MAHDDEDRRPGRCADALDEVRTRRLVVVDEDGNNRIVAEVTGGVAEIRAVLPTTASGRTTAVTLIAGDTPDMGAMVGIAIVADGDSVAEVMACREDGTWRIASWHLGADD